MSAAATYAARAGARSRGRYVVAGRAAPSPARQTGPSLQTKLRIGPVDDPLEREADRVAETVLRGDAAPPAGLSRGASVNRSCTGNTEETIRRECAECEKEDETVRMKTGSGRPREPHPAQAAAAAAAVAAGGAPLPAAARAYFEPRFGRELSSVRVHWHERAAQAASAIHARAFTLGNDIGFARGEYAPQTGDGRKLLAHELAHVLQQAPFVARQPAPYYTRRFQERGGGGTTDFVETVQVAPSPSGTVIQGTVDRSEIAPASGSQPQQTISTGQVRNIRFDPRCFITVPYGILFQQQPSAAPPFCQNPPSATPVTPLPAAAAQGLQTRYIDALNAGLNDRFAVHVEGCSGQPCVGQPIPIIIEARAVTNNPDHTINVVNRSGRGNAGTICAGSYDTSFAVHEGGHQVLGLGDEYRETDPTLRQRVPAWARDERVRTDLTYMGSDYGRFALFHERHFRFAQVFLEAVYRGQGCTVSLEPLRRSPLDFRLEFGAGYLSSNLGGYTALGGSLGIGVPLERERRLSLLIAAQGQYLLGAAPRHRNAFLVGARVGLEAQTSSGSFGLTGNVFAAGGVLRQLENTPPAYLGLPSSPARTSGYGEAGLGIGIQSGLRGGVNYRLSAEAATGREFSGDPEALRWWRVGLNAGLSF